MNDKVSEGSVRERVTLQVFEVGRPETGEIVEDFHLRKTSL